MKFMDRVMMVNRKMVEEKSKRMGRKKPWIHSMERYIKRNLKGCTVTRRGDGVFVFYNFKHYLIILEGDMYLVLFYDPQTGHTPVPAFDFAQIVVAILGDPVPGYEQDDFWEDKV